MNVTTFRFEVSSASDQRELTLDTVGVIWIGREAGADLLLAASNVSRRHVSVERVASGLRVVDASANGTVVNGKLLHGDARILPDVSATLRVGTFRVRVWIAESLNPAPVEAPKASLELRRRIRRALIDELDLPALDRSKMSAAELRPRVEAGLERILSTHIADLPDAGIRRVLVQELADEALGLGPLERLLADTSVSEIMVVDARTIFAERAGKLELTGLQFTDDDAVRAVIERVVTPLGRRIDESTPLVDARLGDGSRVNAVIPPLALRGPCITIRKFSTTALGFSDLVGQGSLTAEMARFLERSVRAKKNIVISGGTGSGKTTLLNVLSSAIPGAERIITVEDAAELKVSQPHVVSLEARPANLEGKGEYTIRDLVKNALRMRPDRIVVGECRGGEAIDMLQAMNTGHEGSLTTTHANSPHEAISRLETLCLMAGLDLPVQAIRRQIASSIHLIVQQTRFSDGSRRVSSIGEVVGLDLDGEVALREIFQFRARRMSESGNVEGEFLASGYLPSFLDEFVARGLTTDGAFP